jgi:DNA-binding CsgD family transcriptional regulator
MSPQESSVPHTTAPDASAALAIGEPILPPPELSRPSVEVMLEWILSDAKGDVCRTLYISIGTVNTHLSRIRAKYDAVGRPAPTKASLLARALQDGHIGLHQL